VKRSKLWEIYTLISPSYFIRPPKLLPYFIPFLYSQICICDTPLNCYYFTHQSYPFAHLTSFRRITKFTTVYGSSVIQLPYCIRISIYIAQTEYD